MPMGYVKRTEAEETKMLDARHHHYQLHRERDRKAMIKLIDGDDRQLCHGCHCQLCGPIEHARGECEYCRWGEME